MICASFGYSPIPAGVRIVSVEANKTDAANPNVAFWVTVEDTSGSAIEFDNHALNFSVAPNSSVLREVQTQVFPGGADVTGSFTLNPAESFTLGGAFPNTKSFYYQVVQPGTVVVNLNFTWNAGTTAILSQFVFT